MNVDKFLSNLYDKFSASVLRDISYELRDAVSFIDEYDDAANYLEWDVLLTHPEVLKEISDASKVEGNQKYAELIDSKLAQKDDMTAIQPEIGPDVIGFFWLNDRVKKDVLSMSPSQKTTLSNSIEKTKKDKSRLTSNFTDIGFATTGNSHLRDLKKKGKNGYRVYFALNGDDKCIIIGKISEKSNTDINQDVIAKFTKIAVDAEKMNTTGLKPVGTISESTVGICFDKSLFETKSKVLNESAIGADLKIFPFNNKGNDYICLIDLSLNLEQIDQMDKIDLISSILSKVNKEYDLIIDDVAGFILTDKNFS